MWVLLPSAGLAYQVADVPLQRRLTASNSKLTVYTYIQFFLFRDPPLQDRISVYFQVSKGKKIVLKIRVLKNYGKNCLRKQTTLILDSSQKQYEIPPFLSLSGRAPAKFSGFQFSNRFIFQNALAGPSSAAAELLLGHGLSDAYS